VEPYPLASNRSMFEAQGLFEIAQLVPEFDNAADWKTYSRNLLFSAMDAQVNPDGGHAESSPGYMGQIISALLESYWLDKRKGEQAAWAGDRLDRLENAAEAYVQLLSPDGNLAALSDTYRSESDSFWLASRSIRKPAVHKCLFLERQQ
jgi:hypothetical protein